MKIPGRLSTKLLCTMMITTMFMVNQRPVDAFEFHENPKHIIIPAIELSLPVVTSQLSYNTWEVSPIYASFGEFTALPGTAGNTVIFAHARPGLFQDLSKLKVGDVIQVFTAYDWFTYQVEDTFTVSPEKVDVILSDEKYELTLFTCTGVGDISRYVVRAFLIPTVN